MTTDLIIRTTAEVSYEQWLPLWNGIHTHHNGFEIPAYISTNTFRRQSEGCPLQGALRGLVAFLDGTPVGFAHYFLHQSSYQNVPVSELEDLYVVPDARGKGVGHALIKEVFRRVYELGATEVRWVTMSTNEQAVKLYDRVGQREPVFTYRTFADQ
jgi:GNAT superfamily N-acetyltransferase